MIFPTYGAKSVWTWIGLREHILPVVAFDDQYCVRFPDGTELWVEKWECDSPFNHNHDKEEIKKRELERAARYYSSNCVVSRNDPSPEWQIDQAFERNKGKFDD